MSSREDILARVRKNQPAPVALPDIPAFGTPVPSLVETFKENFARMGGIFADAGVNADLDAFIRGRFPDAKVFCSAAPEVAGNRAIDQVRSPADLADVDVGIVRGGFAVAETGSVWLNEALFKINALGFLSQHLVVLLDPRDIVSNERHDLHACGRHTGFPWWTLWLIWPLIGLAKWFVPLYVGAITAIITQLSTTGVAPFVAIALVVIGLVLIGRR